MAKTILFSDNSLWGCLNFRGYIIDSLIDQGYKVVIVAPNDSFVKVDILPRAIYEPVEMERTGSNPMKDFAYMMRLRALYKKHKPSLIFHYTIKPNIYGTFAAKMLGIPSVAMVTGLGYVFASGGVTSKIAQNLYKVALGFAGHVVFLNKDNYQLMLERKMVKPETSTLLSGGEGVDTSKFTATPLPTHNQTMFLMVARVLYDKGYSEFVEAAKANPSAKFQLIGAIDTNPKAVPDEVVRSEKAIEYLGFMPHGEVLQHIAQSSCVVLPSYHEGMSVTLTEAIAMARPVICSDIAGCRETVDDGVNGYVVPVKDGKALADACERFVNLSTAQKQEMATASRQKAEVQFDVKDVLTVYKDLINKLAK